MPNRDQDRDRPKAAYVPLTQREREQIREIALREGRSMGGQMRYWVISQIRESGEDAARAGA